MPVILKPDLDGPFVGKHGHPQDNDERILWVHDLQHLNSRTHVDNAVKNAERVVENGSNELKGIE